MKNVEGILARLSPDEIVARSRDISRRYRVAATIAAEDPVSVVEIIIRRDPSRVGNQDVARIAVRIVDALRRDGVDASIPEFDTFLPSHEVDALRKGEIDSPVIVGLGYTDDDLLLMQEAVRDALPGRACGAGADFDDEITGD